MGETPHRSSRRLLESFVAVGSVIACGALMMSVADYLRRYYAQRRRREISDDLLSQVFPGGKLD